MTTVRGSLEVLLERVRVDYNYNGSVDPFVAYTLVGQEPATAYNVKDFDFNDPDLLEWAVAGENDDCVYLEYRSKYTGMIFSAEKDLLADGYLKEWSLTTLDLPRREIKEIPMIPSKEEIVRQVQETIERKDWSKQAVKIMKESSDAVLTRVQQNVAAQLKEDTAPIIQNFVVNLSRSLMDATVNFLEKNSRDATVDLPVFPIGTRYIKQDGNVLNVVIEQPPSARTLFFTRDAAANFDKHVGVESTQPYYLALPYTIFVFQFVNGQYNGTLNVFWRSRPLSHINDELALMPFPNISGGKVCLGEFHANTKNKKIDEQCNHIISGFWQTVFGHDYVDRLTKFLNLNNMTIQQWTAKSKQNPLCAMDFKLSPANLKLQQTFHVDGENNLIALLKQNILTAVGQIGGEVQKLLVDLDVTGENREKVHVETMSEITKQIVVLAYSELWSQLSIKLEKERAVDAEKNRITKDRMKAEFMEWVRSTYPQLQKSTW